MGDKEAAQIHTSMDHLIVPVKAKTCTEHPKDDILNKHMGTKYQHHREVRTGNLSLEIPVQDGQPHIIEGKMLSMMVIIIGHKEQDMTDQLTAGITRETNSYKEAGHMVVVTMGEMIDTNQGKRKDITVEGKEVEPLRKISGGMVEDAKEVETGQ